MAIEFDCDGCFTHYTVKDALAGKTVRCKHCGASITIPDGDDFEEIYEEQPITRPARGGQQRRAAGGNSSSPVKWIVLGGVAVGLLLAVVVLVVLMKPGADAPPAGVAQDAGETPAPAPQPVAAADPPAMVQRNDDDKAEPSEPTNSEADETATAASGEGPPEETTSKPPAMVADSAFQDADGNSKLTFWNVDVDPPAAPRVANAGFNLALGVVPASHLEFSPTHDAVAVRERDERHIWDLAAENKLGAIKDNLSPSFDGAISPQGKYYAGITNTSTAIVLYDVANRKRLGEIPITGDGQTLKLGRRRGRNGAAPPYLAFAGNERLVAFSRPKVNTPTTVQTWSVPSGAPERSFETPAPIQMALAALSPGGRYFAYLLDDVKKRLAAVQVIDLSTGETVGEISLTPLLARSRFSTLRHNYGGLAFSPDGAELAILFAGSEYVWLVAWDVASGDQVVSHELDRDKLDAVGFTMNNPGIQWFPNKQRWLVFGQSIIDREAGGPIWTLPEEGIDRGARRVIDDGHVAVVNNSNLRNVSLQTFDLPEEAIAQAATAVASGGVTEDAGLPPITKADISAAKPVSLDTAASSWNVDVQTAAEVDAILKDKLPLSSTRGLADALFVARPDTGRALVGYDGGAKVKPNAQLDLYDLAAGSSINAFEIPFPCRLLAFSADGTRALLRTGKNEDRLDVWTVDDGSPAVAWRPYGEEEDSERTVIGAAFVDAHHVLTLSKGLKLALWELPACRAVYVIDDVNQIGAATGFEAIMEEHQRKMAENDAKYAEAVRRNKEEYLARIGKGASGGNADRPQRLDSRREAANTGLPAVSPDGKYLAIVTADRCLFLDAITGNARGQIATGGELGAAAFHPNAARFAMVLKRPGGARLVTVDLQSGQLIDEFPLPMSGTALQWTADDTLLLDHASLIDVKHKRIGWTYVAKNAVFAPDPPDSRAFVATADTPQSTKRYLAAFDLPGEKTAAALAADAASPELILGPGMSVGLKLNVKGVPDASEFTAALREKLTADFQQAGVTVAAGQPVTLTVDVALKNTGETMTFKQFGGGRSGANDPGTRVPLTLVICRFSAQHNGRDVWSDGRGFDNQRLGLVHLERGENVAAKLAEDQWKAASDYCLNAQVPVVLFAESAQRGLGQSPLGQ